MKKQEKFISKEEKKKTGKLKRAIAVGATTLAAVGLCLNQTGALAYLTDYAHVTNKFIEGKVSITPSEPNWTHDPEDPGDKEQVTPGDIFNKDPQITADEDSISPAFVYMQWMRWKNPQTQDESNNFRKVRPDKGLKHIRKQRILLRRKPDATLFQKD